MLYGDVAQLGERLVRNEQVEGSNPFVSSRAGVATEVLQLFEKSSKLGEPFASQSVDH